MIQHTSVSYPSITSELIEHGDNKFSVIVKPLLPGFGHTLGNSIRRVLLSTIPGFAITKIRINDITHEYQAIDGISEDALNVILNLKQVRTKILVDDDVVTISLKKNKKGDIFAGDFETEKKVEIANPDLYICHLGKDTEFTIEVEISRGVGYLPAEKINFAGNLNPQDILVDALFSPVTNVSVEVEKVRVGDRTDFDQLNIQYATDGTQDGKEIAVFVLDFIANLFNQIKSSLVSDAGSSSAVQTEKVESKSENTDEIKLAEDILAILEKNGITTNSQLKENLDQVNDFSGITKKKFKDIEEYVKSL